LKRAGGCAHDGAVPVLPALPLAEWRDTLATLHMWTQVVGKVRLGLTPLVNHWWNVTLYVTPRGLTTSAIPYRDTIFDMEFDFVDHVLELRTTDGDRRHVVLEPQSVATFYRRTMETLDAMGLPVRISHKPNEVPEPVRFDRDEAPRAAEGGEE